MPLISQKLQIIHISRLGKFASPTLSLKKQKYFIE